MKGSEVSFEEMSKFEKDKFESMVVNKNVDFDILRKDILPKYLLMMKLFKKKLHHNSDHHQNKQLATEIFITNELLFDKSQNNGEMISTEFGFDLREHIEFLRNEFSEQIDYLEKTKKLKSEKDLPVLEGKDLIKHEK